MHSAEDFPNGFMSMVTDNPRVDEKLRRETAAAGLLRSNHAGILVIEVDSGGEDDAGRLFSGALSLCEQDQVFLLAEPPAPWRLSSLRTVLARHRTAWFSEFLRTGRVRSHLQPIVDLRERSVFGFEALFRGELADGTPLLPVAAFEAARETDQIAALDRKARHAALEAGARLLSPSEKLFVNVDAAGLPGGAADLDDTLELARRLPQAPGGIVFELVESESLASSSPLHSMLDRLREEGFLIALDDLTSGFSTLAVLDRLRPDIAKLDQRLVHGAWSDRYRARLVRAFVDLAEDLDLPLVLEGVEDEDDYAFICDLGAHLAQGYYFARPAADPVREIAVFRNHRAVRKSA